MIEPESTTEELQNEGWRTIPDFPDYEISTMGQIRRAIYSPFSRGMRHITPNKKRTGYLHVGLYKDGKRIHLAIHRLVAATWIGSPPFSSAQVNHKNGVRDDNRAGNLEWVTPKANKRHAIEVLGHTIGGEQHPHSSLTASLVLAIHDALMTGEPSGSIGKRLGVPTYQVYRIRHRQAWQSVLKNLPSDYPQSRKPNCKLSPEEVRQIRALALAGSDYGEIARQFNTTKSTVCHIKRGNTWRSIC